MTWHTVKEACELTGRSRRTLYRDIDRGKLSGQMGSDGQRRFESQELIALYGPFVVSHKENVEGGGAVVPISSIGEGPETVSVRVADLTALLDEVRSMRTELADLKQSMPVLLERRLRTALPAPGIGSPLAPRRSLNELVTSQPSPAVSRPTRH